MFGIDGLSPTPVEGSGGRFCPRMPGVSPPPSLAGHMEHKVWGAFQVRGCEADGNARSVTGRREMRSLTLGFM